MPGDRQRECTDVFIPALVGWRVELDVPAGVAEADRTTGRDALVAKARRNGRRATPTSNSVGLCRGILATIPDDQLAPMMEIGERRIA